MSSLSVAVVVMFFAGALNVESAAVAKCTLPFIKDELPNWFPLISNNVGSIVYPEETSPNSNQWAISIPVGDTVTFSCTEQSVTSVLRTVLLSENTYTCNSNGVLTSLLHSVTNFSDMGCATIIKESITKNGLCYNSRSNIDISFSSASGDFPLIKMCLDDKGGNTLMAQHTIQGGALNPIEVSNDRPSFKSGTFYKGFSVITAYTQSSQLAIFKNLFGDVLANKYISLSESFYFARGHLAPDGDFVHIYEQNATYYYVNVIPQWQAINNGNWKAMEMAIRDYATTNKVDLNIWTGGHGVLTLDDENGNPIEVYLAKDNQLPVPKIAWKVIEDPTRNASVAIVMINNPHLQLDDVQSYASGLLCDDICDEISWVDWSTEVTRKGYTYCCSVDDLRKIVPNVPVLKSTTILN